MTKKRINNMTYIEREELLANAPDPQAELNKAKSNLRFMRVAIVFAALIGLLIGAAIFLIIG
jgi:hypothetical protein